MLRITASTKTIYCVDLFYSEPETPIINWVSEKIISVRLTKAPMRQIVKRYGLSRMRSRMESQDKQL